MIAVEARWFARVGKSVCLFISLGYASRAVVTETVSIL